MRPSLATSPDPLRRCLAAALHWTGRDARGDAFVEATWRLTVSRLDGVPGDPRWRYEEGAALRCWHHEELFFAAAPGSAAEALARCLEQLDPAVGAPRPPVEASVAGPAGTGHPPPAVAAAAGTEAARYLKEVERDLRQQLPDGRLHLSLVKTARQTQVASEQGRLQAGNWHWVRFRLSVGGPGGGPAVVWAGGAPDLAALRRRHPVAALGPMLARRLEGLESSGAPVCSASTPLLFAAGNGAMPLHELVHGLESDSLARGWSAWTPWQNSPHALSPLLTLWDDPVRPGLRGSYAVDDEASPADRRLLVQRGKIVGCLADRRGVERLAGCRPGHGRRSSWQEWPLPRAANLCMARGGDRLEEIRRQPGEVLEILEIQKAATDPASGEMSLCVADGRWLEAGKVICPVSGLMLEGNVLELAQAIDRVCGERRQDSGAATCGREESGIPIGFLTPWFRSRGLREVGQRETGP